MMQETREEAVLTASAHSIRVTEALRDGDHLTFIVISQKLSGTGEYHVDRTYEDFEWLHQHLFDQEEGPGIQGVIFPPLPVRPQVNASAKVLKQLGFLAIGNNWKIYCVALETYLQQVAAHTKLSKNKAVEIFLTNSEPPGRHKMRKGIFNRLSQAVEGMRKEGHKDVDEFFQTERLNNQTMTGCTKSATESFLDVVLTEQKIAVACGHLSTALHLFVENGEDPATQAFSRMCVKISEVIDSIKKNFESVADNNGRTLGQGLDLESRHQEAVKEMLFRRTCKLVELETASRNAERAKPIKKAAMEEVKKAAEEEFDVISAVAKQEIARFQALRVEMLRQALICWCETQLQTARESHERYRQHLQDFREMGQ